MDLCNRVYQQFYNHGAFPAHHCALPAKIKVRIHEAITLPVRRQGSRSFRVNVKKESLRYILFSATLFNVMQMVVYEINIKALTRD